MKKGKIILSIIVLILTVFLYDYYIQNQLKLVEGYDKLYTNGDKSYCIGGKNNRYSFLFTGEGYRKQKLDIEFPSTIVKLSYNYFKDKDNIYEYNNDCYWGSVCACSVSKQDYDVNSFTVLEGGYISDKNGIYNFGNKVDIEDYENRKK